MNMNEFFAAFSVWEEHQFSSGDTYVRQMAPHLILNDGTTLSVQASETHYCSPRENIKGGPYSAFEIGFPSVKIDSLMPYAEDEEKPTETVYGWVPVDVIDKIIDNGGGIDIRAVVKNIVDAEVKQARLEERSDVGKETVKAFQRLSLQTKGYSPDDFASLFDSLKKSAVQ